MMIDFLVGITCGIVPRISSRLFLTVWLACLLVIGLWGWIPLYRDYGTPPTALQFSWLFLIQRVAVINIGGLIGYGFADWVARVVAEVRKEIL